MSMSTQRKFSAEDFFNMLASDDDADGLLKNLRIKNALQPLEGYHISDQALGATSYYGYLNKDGGWYILRGIDAGGGETNYTYAAGDSGYNWAGRAAATYAIFSTTF